MRTCARGYNFFSGYDENIREKKFIKLVKSNLKNKSLKYEKSEKLTFEVSNLVKKVKTSFFHKKNLAHAIESKFYSASFQKDDLKNKSLNYENSVKQTFEISVWVKK